METQQIYTEKPNAETIWAILQETDRIVKETAELQRQNAEKQGKALDKQEKALEEQKRRAKHLDKKLGKLGDRFGEMVEYMVMPNLVRKFRKLGYKYTKANPHTVIADYENKIFMEIDITLEDGDNVMIVEVKSKPSTADITEHIERMEKVRLHADLHDHKRKFFGAIAGMVFNENEKIFALKKGFYVIEPSGDTFSIIVPDGEYSPGEW